MAENQLKFVDNTVIIPGNSVLMTSVCLPKMPRTELRRAIPFALEEELAQNIEECFFAIGETNAAGETAVAVMDKSRFESYLSIIQENHWQPEKIIPDYLALPYEENAWTVWYHDEWVSVRTGLLSGFCVEKINLEVMQSFFGTPPKMIEIKENHFDTSINFNLLQDKYRPKKSISEVSRLWRRSIYVTSLLIITAFTSQIGQYVYFQHQSKQLHKKITSLYHRILPSQTGDPHRSIHVLLNRLQHSTGSQHLIYSLNTIGPFFSNKKTLQLERLEYTKTRLMLTIQSKSPEALTDFSKALSKKGLTVHERDLKIYKKRAIAVLEVTTS